MQSLLRILPLFTSLDLEGLRDLPLTRPQTHKHSENCLHFSHLILINLWRWQGKNEPVSLERSQNSEFISAFKWSSQVQTCLCFFNVGFTYCSTLPVWNLCRSSGYQVCLFPRQVWTCFMLSIGVKTVVAASWQESLGLRAETLAIPETLRNLLVVRKMSCCCFHLDQTNSRQSSKKYDFDSASFKVCQPWFFRAGLWCLDSSIVWGREKLTWRSLEACYICIVNFQIGILRLWQYSNLKQISRDLPL